MPTRENHPLAVILLAAVALGVPRFAWAGDAFVNPAVETEGQEAAFGEITDGEIVNAWWNVDERRRMLAASGKSESNFVAVCVGGHRFVCTMPSIITNREAARYRLESLRRRLGMMREIDADMDDRFGRASAAFATERLKQEAMEIFQRIQRERDIIVAHARPDRHAEVRKRFEMRSREERQLLDGVLKRLDELSQEASDRPAGTDTALREALDAELRSRGVPDCQLEILRLERELREREHRQFRERGEGHFTRRRQRAEVDGFSALLNERVSADRYAELEHPVSPKRRAERANAASTAAPPATGGNKYAKRRGRANLPPGQALKQAMWRDRARPGTLDWYLHDKEGQLILAILAVLAFVALVWIGRRVFPVLWLVLRQNDFRRRYEDGTVVRPLGDGVCWFCGEKAPRESTTRIPEGQASTCPTCSQAVGLLYIWAYSLAFLCAAAVFFLAIYRIDWSAWCGQNRFVSYSAGVILAVIALVFLIRGLYVWLPRLIRARLACRGNLEFELAARAEAIRRQDEQMFRDEFDEATPKEDSEEGFDDATMDADAEMDDNLEENEVTTISGNETAF